MTIKARVVKSVFDPVRKSETLKIHRTYDYIPCKSIQDQALIEGIKQSEGFIDFLMCPDFRGEPEEFIFETNKNNNTYLTVQVYPCSLPDKTKCASAQQIKRISFRYRRLKKLLVASDFENPIKDHYITRIVQLDPTLKKQVKTD